MQGVAWEKARPYYLVAAAVFVSAVLCLAGIGRPSFWIDEAHSYEFAALPSAWLVILNSAARDAYPPLYFVLLHFWMKLGGSETWLRLFSVLAHLCSIPLAYAAGRRLVSRDAGLVAAILVALSPFHAAFAREVRMYSMLGLLSIASMLALMRWEKERSRLTFWLWGVSGLALVYTHFIGMFLLAAQFAYLVFERRRPVPWKEVAKWLFLLAAGFLPWSPFFLKALVVTRGYGSESAAPGMVVDFLGALASGFGQARWLMAFSAVVILAVALGGWLVLAPSPGRRLLACWAFVPPALEIAVSAFGKPVFGERTLIVSTPAWLLLASAAIVGMRPWKSVLAAASLGILAGLGFSHAFSYGLKTAPSTREAVEYALGLSGPDDVILHSSTVTYHPVHEYYLPRSKAGMKDYMVEPQGVFKGGRLGEGFRSLWRKLRGRLDPEGVLRTGADPFRLDEEEFLAAARGRVWYFRTTLEGSRRLWYLVPSVFYSRDPGKLGEIPFASHPLLFRRFALKSEKNYPGLAIELWERR